MDSDYEPNTRIVFVKPTEDRPGEDCLVVIHAPEHAALGRRYVLSKHTTSIGRGRDNDIVLACDSVSRRHGQIEQRDGAVYLVDQASTNGTFVNDESQRATERLLNRGDRLRMGDTIFKYLAGSDVEAQYHEAIFRMSVTDGLTNLCNRKQLDQRLDEELPRAGRHGRALSLLLMDIDHFKSINDTHGHVAGDSVLREVAAVMQKRVRTQDCLGRYGGEEFCAILSETSLMSAQVLAEELRAMVESHGFVTEDGQRISVTISIGAAQWKPGMQRADLYRSADAMLYKAKHAGRNRVCC